MLEPSLVWELMIIKIDLDKTLKYLHTFRLFRPNYCLGLQEIHSPIRQSYTQVFGNKKRENKVMADKNF